MGNPRQSRRAERLTALNGSAEYAEPASDTMNTGSARQPPGGANWRTCRDSSM